MFIPHRSVKITLGDPDSTLEEHTVQTRSIHRNRNPLWAQRCEWSVGGLRHFESNVQQVRIER